MLAATKGLYSVEPKSLGGLKGSQSISVTKPVTKQIAFGDADCPDYYSFDQEIKRRIALGQEISGNEPESAFSSFYLSVKSELANKKIIEDRKGSKRDYFVRTEMPHEQGAFVNTLSGFTRKYGNRPNFTNWDTAIDHYLTNSLGLIKPKWYDFFSESVFSDKKAMLNDMSVFFKKGLVNIRNLK